MIFIYEITELNQNLVKSIFKSQTKSTQVFDFDFFLEKI